MAKDYLQWLTIICSTTKNSSKATISALCYFSAISLDFQWLMSFCLTSLRTSEQKNSSMAAISLDLQWRMSLYLRYLRTSVAKNSSRAAFSVLCNV